MTEDTLLPPAPSVDPRAQRLGAALSAVTLTLGVLAGLAGLSVLSALVTAIVFVSLLTSSLFGLRYFLFGRPWPVVKGALGLGDVEREHEYPPRFAQAMGATVLAVALVLHLLGLPAAAVAAAVVVVALQTLLAATGFCLGCRLYGVRWYIPAVFARLARRTSRSPLPPGTQRIRFNR